jgi:hypothetical protein
VCKMQENTEQGGVRAAGCEIQKKYRVARCEIQENTEQLRVRAAGSEMQENTQQPVVRAAGFTRKTEQLGVRYKKTRATGCKSMQLCVRYKKALSSWV